VAVKFFVGIGGTGCGIAQRLHEKLQLRYGNNPAARDSLRAFGFDGVPFQQSNLPDAAMYCWTGAFHTDALIEELQRSGVDVLSWWPYARGKAGPYWGINGLGQRRPIGMLALLNHLNNPPDGGARALNAILGNAHNAAMAATQAQGLPEFTIVLGGSLCGGTGAGLMIATAMYLRETFSAGNKLRIIGVGLLPDTQKGKPATEHRWWVGNAHGFLWELEEFEQEPAAFEFQIDRNLTLKGKAAPFDAFFLFDGANADGRTLDNYREYEQLVADVLFDLEFAGQLPVLANIAASISGGMKTLGSGGKAVVRFPILKHQRAIARRILEYILARDASIDSTTRELGETRRNVLWGNVRDALIHQDYGRAFLRFGQPQDLVPAAAMAERLATQIDAMDEDNCRTTREAIEAQWSEYRERVQEFIRFNKTRELKEDWETLNSELQAALVGANALPLASFQIVVEGLVQSIASERADIERRRRTVEELAQRLEPELKEELEEAVSAYQSKLLMPWRRHRREAVKATLRSLLGAYWEERVALADLEHLSSLGARLQESFARGVSELQQVLAAKPADTDLNDLYAKLAAVIDVGGGEKLAARIFENLIAGKVAEHLRILETAETETRDKLGRFLCETVLPTMNAGHELTQKLRDAWSVELWERLLTPIEINVQPLITQDVKSVWEALRRDAIDEGRGADVLGYIRERLLAAAKAAAVFVSRTPVDEHAQNYNYVHAGISAWADFAGDYPRELMQAGSGQPIPLGQFLGGAYAVENHAELLADSRDPRQPGNRFEIAFFNFVVGFGREKLISIGDFQRVVRTTMRDGFPVFIDRRFTPYSVATEAKKLSLLLFMMGLGRGCIRECADGYYVDRGRDEQDKRKARVDLLKDFLSGPSRERQLIVRTIDTWWRAASEGERKKFVESLRTLCQTPREGVTEEFILARSAVEEAIEHGLWIHTDAVSTLDDLPTNSTISW
jgi:hypothetical protein